MFSKRNIYYLLSPNIRYFVRRFYFLPIDLWESITGKRDKITPPKGLIFIGPGDFKKIGENYLNFFIEYCGLKPEHRVLDIGCGIGRIAIPLTKYLNNNGSYEGFDIVKKGIDWCNKHIKRAFPNFNFLHIDLKNDLYNLKTNHAAKNFIFPYKTNEFDLIILTSVFTHMIPDDVENYLKEINKVMKVGGKCLATFFILNDSSRELMKSHDGLNFKYKYGNYSLLDKNVKEANVAYNEEYLFKVIKQNNLIVEKSMYGFWPGRPRNESLDFQDILILSKN
jgi:SAM-dependent methyltransferase